MLRLAASLLILGTLTATAQAQGAPETRRMLKFISIQVGIEACDIDVPPATMTRLETAATQAAEKQTEITSEAQLQAAVGGIVKNVTENKDAFCRSMKAQPIDKLVDAAIAE